MREVNIDKQDGQEGLNDPKLCELIEIGIGTGIEDKGSC